MQAPEGDELEEGEEPPAEAQDPQRQSTASVVPGT